MSLLRTEHLVKKGADRLRVDHVTLEVCSGEIVGLLGPNSAGKRTLCEMMAGLEGADAGRVLLDGQDVTRLPLHERARMGIVYLTQQPAVFSQLTVAENLHMIFESRKLSSCAFTVLTTELLSEFGLEHVADQKAATLDFWQKRRLQILRALVIEPKLLLMDVPFSGLNESEASEARGLINKLKSRGIGILITDCHVREMLSLIDRGYIFHKGKVMVEGTGDFLGGENHEPVAY